MRHQNLLDFAGVLAFLGILAAFLGAIPSNALAQPVKLDDLIKGHLESIGPEESRRAVENLVISGTGAITCQRGCIGTTQGPATIASAMGKRLIAMKFNSVSYPGERFLFNGKSVEVAKLPQAQYSVLGLFFFDNRIFMGEGLLGGTLTQGWPLLDLVGRKPRLIKYQGLREVEGRKLHDVEFRPRGGGSDFNVHLYFEPDTYRHVITRYSTALSGMADDALPHQVVERFSDFLVENGLTLPHGYEMQFEGPRAMLQWRMRLTKFQANLKIDPAMFEASFDAK
jgi:hypothetical protein